MSKKQDYFQRTEALLYKYTFIKCGIEEMEDELKAFLIDYGVGSVDPGKESFKTNRFSSVVENAVINKNDSESVKKLKSSLKIQKKLINKVDKIMLKLQEDERKIVEMYYFKGKQWFIIANEVHYSEKWCAELRRRAIEKIAIGLAYAIVVEVDREKQAV